MLKLIKETKIYKLFNPRTILEESFVGEKWYLSLCISSAAFMLYFVQAFLDVNQTYNTPFSIRTIAIVFLGFLFGSLGIAFLGIISWLTSKFFGGDMSLNRIIAGFALGYSTTLLFMILGLLFNVILGWNTSLSFGITGVLWAFMPMTLIIRKSVRGKTIPTAVITTICAMLIVIAFSSIHLL